MEPSGESAPYAEVVVSFEPDLGLRPVVRSIAVEAANADSNYAQQVRETADTLVCVLLQTAQEDSHLHCLFCVLDGEMRIRASVSNPPVLAPEAKGRSARLLDRLDVHVSTYTARDSDEGVEVVYEAVVPRRDRGG